MSTLGPDHVMPSTIVSVFLSSVFIAMTDVQFAVSCFSVLSLWCYHYIHMPVYRLANCKIMSRLNTFEN